LRKAREKKGNPKSRSPNRRNPAYFLVFWCGMFQSPESDPEALIRIIVGLGNPGERYTRTRHNVGFMILEALAREAGKEWSPWLLVHVCRTEISGCPVLLAKPQTYMNQSGRAVHDLLSALHRNSEDLLLILDDLNLPFGNIRVRERGTAGGHHGLESVLTTVNSDAVARIRVGIGEGNMPDDKAGFVLSDFPSDRQAELDAVIHKAGNAVKSILHDGISKTMAIFNA
jgi:peptidyl-tRNA hydrolase, PTH1 family